MIAILNLVFHNRIVATYIAKISTAAKMRTFPDRSVSSKRAAIPYSDNAVIPRKISVISQQNLVIGEFGSVRNP